MEENKLAIIKMTIKLKYSNEIVSYFKDEPIRIIDGKFRINKKLELARARKEAFLKAYDYIEFHCIKNDVTYKINIFSIDDIKYEVMCVYSIDNEASFNKAENAFVIEKKDIIESDNNDK